MLVHAPIVLTPAASFLLLVALFNGFRSKLLLALASLALVVAAVGAGLAAGAGEDAMEHIHLAASGVEVPSQPDLSARPLTESDAGALRAHESMGEGAWMWAIGAAVLAAIPIALNKGKRRTAAGLVALLIAAGVSIRYGLTAHTGGVLVYEHGLGVPVNGENDTPMGSATDAAPSDSVDEVVPRDEAEEDS
jgi:hypothetical protein